LMATPTVLIAFVAGLAFGAKGVALAYSSVMCALIFPCLAFAAHQTPVQFRQLLRTIAPPTAAGAVSALIGVVVSGGMELVSSVIELIIIGVFVGGFYAMCTAAILSLDPAFSTLRNTTVHLLATGSRTLRARRDAA